MKTMLLFLLVIIVSAVFTTCGGRPDEPEKEVHEVPFAAIAPVIDGIGNDAAWEKAKWRPINQVWLGGGNASETNLSPPPAGTFSGWYKIVWTEDSLYFLVEIMDTHLSLNRIADPYDEIFNDDCLELFINEEAKGGNHEANNIAFAYHLSYDGESVMDYVAGRGNTGPFQNNYINRSHHVKYKIGNLDLPNKKSISGNNVYIWETEMKVFNKNYPINGNSDYTPETLYEGKEIGYAVAYCNAGPSKKREYFMGSVFIPGIKKNVAYQDASVFGKMKLVK